MISPDDSGYSDEMTVSEGIGCVAIALLFIAAIIIGAAASAWRAVN